MSAVRTYVRTFPSTGIDPVTPSNYEIIDGNTFFDKQNERNMKIHKFNYIFTSPEFENRKIVQHLNLAGSAAEGRSQYVIADIDLEHLHQFIEGTADDPGFVIEMFAALFEEIRGGVSTTGHSNETLTSPCSWQHQQLPENGKSGISLSIFAADDNSNRFIDLILNQKFTFYSKKDMDEYKDFYSKQIRSMREFFICLKIAMVHYKECCREGDPINFRVSVNFQDEQDNTRTASCLHLFVVERKSQASANILKKVQSSLKGQNSKGEDHGTLANYIQRQITKNKLMYIYGIPYRKMVMNSSVRKFEFMTTINRLKTTVPKNVMRATPRELIPEFNHDRVPDFSFEGSPALHKEIQAAIRLLKKMVSFLDESACKWRVYCRVIRDILRIQYNFYEKQKFPVGLEIKEGSCKNYLISKVYKLSEDYHCEDLSPEFEKLRTIKNQMFISLNALARAKQAKQFHSLSTLPISNLQLQMLNGYSPKPGKLLPVRLLPTIPTRNTKEATNIKSHRVQLSLLQPQQLRRSQLDELTSSRSPSKSKSPTSRNQSHSSWFRHFLSGFYSQFIAQYSSALKQLFETYTYNAIAIYNIDLPKEIQAAKLFNPEVLNTMLASLSNQNQAKQKRNGSNSLQRNTHSVRHCSQEQQENPITVLPKELDQITPLASKRSRQELKLSSVMNVQRNMEFNLNFEANKNLGYFCSAQDESVNTKMARLFLPRLVLGARKHRK